MILGEFDEKSDIWSCGVILFLLLSGTAPFNGLTNKNIHERIVEGHYEMPLERWSHISEEAKALVKKMLEYNPEKRISAADALEHPWIEETARATENVHKEAFQEVLRNLKAYKVVFDY